jgi:hypothetical protein
MKLGQPRESHPFDLITHHLSEIAKQLTRQKMRKVPQAQIDYLYLGFISSLTYILNHTYIKSDTPFGDRKFLYRI